MKDYKLTDLLRKHHPAVDWGQGNMERKVKVVIIEFLPVMGDILKSTLNELNNVEVAGLANDYNIGKELINQLHPDFLVCDYNPHNLDSLEMIASYRATFPDMKIIIITGFDISEHIYNLVDMKVNGVIDKASEDIKPYYGPAPKGGPFQVSLTTKSYEQFTFTVGAGGEGYVLCPGGKVFLPEFTDFMKPFIARRANEATSYTIQIG